MLVRLVITFMAISNCCVAIAGQSTDSVRVYFRQGSAVIDPGFSGNGMSLKDFDKRLKNMMRFEDAGVWLRSVTILGAVSPEGSKRVNDRLARRRAEEFARLLITRFSIPDSVINVMPIGVDWNALADRVEADRLMPYRDEVGRILRRAAADPERYNGLYKIKQVDPDGAAYRHFMARHFPAMRTATAYLAFDIAPLSSIGADVPCLSVSESSVVPPCVEPVCRELATTAGTMAKFATEPSTPLSSRWIPIVLKTNMLYDAAAIPNLGLEVALGENWSVEANWMYAWWSRDIGHRYWRVYGGEVGARRWFGGQGRQVLTGHHVGIYGQMLTYDFEFGGKGWQGGRWTWGGGVAYGYSLPVGRCFNIDFTIGFGYAGGEYKKYHPDNNCYVWDSTHRLNWFGPTKAEVSLVWYIDGRPFRKGGVR